MLEILISSIKLKITTKIIIKLILLTTYFIKRVVVVFSQIQNNNSPKIDSGILQTWAFAHPKNKRFTGPYDKFKNMIKKDSYSILINHKSHEVKEMFKNENVATYEVVILGKDKKFYKFKWQVEKYNKEGPLKNCWLTTAVLAPKVLGSSV